MNQRRTSLLNQILAANVLMVTATLFVAVLVAGGDFGKGGSRFEFLAIALAMVINLIVNLLMLRRYFSPLERLIKRLEAIDPAQPSSFGPQEQTVVQEIDRLAYSFRRLLGRIEAEQRRSGRMVIRAQEDERKRVARDLHDEVNQALTAILLRLEALAQDAPPELSDQVAELKSLVNQAMDELLQLARQLRPSALDDHGLIPAIEGHLKAFSSKTGIKATLSARGQPQGLGDDQQTAVYRVVQEALSNAARHSGASRITVDLEAFKYGGVELRVTDDGTGFDLDNRKKTNGTTGDGRVGGLGLDGMTERARLVGGDLQVESQPGRGTKIRLYIP
jgi:two-component system sensor histidine kinase UhpB